MLNRIFGQKPQEEPKKDAVAAQERAEGDSVSEQGAVPLKNSLSRTRQIFSRLGDAFRQNEITDTLWDELEESLLRADVGPGTTTWLLERLQKRAAEERMKSGAQVQRALREPARARSHGDRARAGGAARRVLVWQRGVHRAEPFHTAGGAHSLHRRIGE